MRESLLEKFNRYLLSQTALEKSAPLLQQPSITAKTGFAGAAEMVVEAALRKHRDSLQPQSKVHAA